MKVEFFELLVASILVGGGIYFRQYFSEKAKNLASREDIATITKVVEAAKIDYSRQLENFSRDAVNLSINLPMELSSTLIAKRHPAAHC